MRRGNALLLLFLALLVGGAACGTPTAAACDFQQGQAPKSGIEAVLQATCDLGGKTCTADELAPLSDTCAIINHRLTSGLGLSQLLIQQQGNDRIKVDLPPLKNEQAVLTFLAQTGKLEILDTGPVELALNQPVPSGSSYPVAFTGADLDPTTINATLDQQTGQSAIFFHFKADKQSAFADYTRAHIGQFLTMTLDNVVIESAVIQSEITGQAEISGGSMTLDEAQRTAALLRYGPLPVPLTLVDEHAFGAALGQPAHG